MKRKTKKKMALILAAVFCLLLSGCREPPGGIATSQIEGNIISAEYPEMARYPEINGWDYDENEYNAWRASRKAQEPESKEYQEGMKEFYLATIPEFLGGAEDQNRIYSPLNIYMALAMLAETTEGESRSQILELLHTDTIENLRTKAKTLWNANYCDDGTVTSLLASSVWLSDKLQYNKKVLETLADTYYASSFSGEMGSAKYNKALQDWLNAQTGDLLLDYRSWENNKTLVVNQSIPKFDVVSDIDFKEILRNLGVTDVLDEKKADFTPMTNEPEVYLQQAKHAARVMIDEEGCQAVAYTVLAASGEGMPPEDEIDFVLNRPFMFLLNGQDGQPLFIGIVNQP